VLKTLFAFDTSLSMATADPSGSRTQALLAELDREAASPQDPLVSVLFFSGATPAWRTRGGGPGFVPAASLSPTDRQALASSIESIGYPDPSSNPGGVDFVGPLSAIDSAIAQDLAAGSASGAPSATQYRVIWVSGGAPAFPEDPRLFALCSSLHARSTGQATVVLDTVFLFEPETSLPPCADGGGCPTAMVQADAARLQQMAQLGGGQFQDDEGQRPVDFTPF
jgi:hypothetical protein